jgi:glycosyltransferase involved in cell wall biosynthesis
MAKDQLNICLISREFPPDTAWGGIATSSLILAKSYLGLGHDVTVFSLSMSENCVQEFDGITVQRIKVTNRFLKQWHKNLPLFVVFYNWYLYRRVLDLHKQRPFDVIDAPEHLAEGLSPAIHGKIPNITRLYTPFSLFVDLGLNAYRKDISYRFVKLFEKIAISKATLLTGPSLDLVEKVRQYLKVNRHVEIIPNPIDIEMFSPGENAQQGDLVRVLFLGRLEDRKGIFTMAEAVPIVCRQCDSVRFTLIGMDTRNIKGHDSAREYLREKWRSENCLDRVEFINYLPLTEVIDYYRSHDLVWVPSLYDNSPFTCLEAMACGKPVIGSKAGGIPEYFSSEDEGIVVPVRDHEALADATIDLVRNREKRLKIGQCARDKAVRVYSGQVVAERNIELYRRAIHTKG